MAAILIPTELITELTPPEKEFTPVKSSRRSFLPKSFKKFIQGFFSIAFNFFETRSKDKEVECILEDQDDQGEDNYGYIDDVVDTIYFDGIIERNNGQMPGMRKTTDAQMGPFVIDMPDSEAEDLPGIYFDAKSEFDNYQKPKTQEENNIPTKARKQFRCIRYHEQIYLPYVPKMKSMPGMIRITDGQSDDIKVAKKKKDLMRLIRSKCALFWYYVAVFAEFIDCV